MKQPLPKLAPGDWSYARGRATSDSQPAAEVSRCRSLARRLPRLGSRAETRYSSILHDRGTATRLLESWSDPTPRPTPSTGMLPMAGDPPSSWLSLSSRCSSLAQARHAAGLFHQLTFFSLYSWDHLTTSKPDVLALETWLASSRRQADGHRGVQGIIARLLHSQTS